MKYDDLVKQLRSTSFHISGSWEEAQTLDKLIQGSADAIEELQAKVKELEDVLLRNGFDRCDIPACNCGSWHPVRGYPERFAEIKAILCDADHPFCNENGNLITVALKGLVDERDTLRQQLEVEKLETERLTVLLCEANKDEGDGVVYALRQQLEACAAALPGPYYMDPPDGGGVSVSEQLRRMGEDAALWRAYQERKQKAINAGMGRSPLRGDS